MNKLLLATATLIAAPLSAQQTASPTQTPSAPAATAPTTAQPPVAAPAGPTATPAPVATTSTPAPVASASTAQSSVVAQAKPTPAPAPQPVVTARATPVAPAPSGPAMTSGAGAITATPATTPAQVAAIVAREFPAYDKDRDGALTTAEFGDWMLKLKTIADPTLQPTAPATRTWLGAAFAQADADRSRAVTLAELTGFLTPTAM